MRLGTWYLHKDREVKFVGYIWMHGDLDHKVIEGVFVDDKYTPLKCDITTRKVTEDDVTNLLREFEAR